MLKKYIIYLLTISMMFISVFTSCSHPCDNGHTWIEATCTTPQQCSVCSEINGNALGHDWSEATCSTPAKCSRCDAKNYLDMKEHSYNERGICSVCGATKEYGNSYGYFSKSELFNMAQDAIKDYAYPNYVSNFCLLSEIYVEKITDTRLQYGTDSFSIVAYADFTTTKTVYEETKFVVVIEPHNSTTYVFKDAYIE